MQKYKEINGNDYVKNSRTTINETMQSIQSMNSGTAFPTNNLFEGMKCYRTDLKKTYTLTDVENNTWVEDAHATLSDEATHAASATKLQTARSLNLGGAVTADAATFDGTANATINVKTLDATKLKGTASVSTTGNAATASKLSTVRKINITGNATGSANFDGTSDVSINVSVSQAAHADRATADKYGADIADNYIKHYIKVSTQDLNDIRVGGLYAQSLSANATTARHYPENEACSILVIQNGANGVDGCTQICTTFASHNSYKREYDVVSKTWSAWRRYAFEDSTVSSAQKLSTARKINITGNATGAAAFDGTSDVSINVSVSQAAHADKATAAGSANKLFYSEHGGNSIQNGANDFSPTVGGDSANMNITSWYGVSFTNGCNSGVIPQGKTAVGIDVRNSVVRAKTFEGALNGNSATATKLATARAISLTGNASGSANFDGSGNVSINTTVNESKHAAAATALDIFAYRPSDANIQKGDGLVRHFLATSGMSKNKPPEGDGHILSFAWDNNGGYDAQLCVNNTTGRINMRGQYAGKWSDWLTVLDSANFNSYAPTKTGAGASGTWPISVSGNATTATNADTVDGVHAGSLFYNKGKWDADNWATMGAYQTNGTPPVSGAYGWGQVISSSTDYARFQLYVSDNYGENGRLYYRTGWSNTKHQWNTILDSENYNSFAPTKTGGGATGTWGINISGNAASATNADKVDGYHASDIINRISAANTGGIVAASLTENGYAKFANGLILQWGTRTEPKVDDWVCVTTTFPITFASACFSVTCCDELTSTYDRDVEFFVRNIKTNSVDIRYRSDSHGRNLRWLALGV